MGSFTKESQCPPEKFPEYALIGRSNVGKSSLLNMICDHKELALVSSKPGKTQTINYFNMDSKWRLVDLPGYGYAKTSKANRYSWSKMISYFLQKRENLVCTFVLIDSSIKPQKIDIEFTNWLGEKRIPFMFIFTKSDKAKIKEVESNIDQFWVALSDNWQQMPPYFVTSAVKNKGKEEILEYISEVNEQFYQVI